MFTNNRYLTRGIHAEIPPDLQAYLWNFRTRQEVLLLELCMIFMDCSHRDGVMILREHRSEFGMDNG